MNVSFSRPRVDAILSSAKSIYVSGFTAEITEAPELFRQHQPADATVTGLFSPLMNRRSYADPDIGLRVRSFLLTPALKRDLSTGMVDYCPWRYGAINRWLAAPGRFDTALVMMSPPDNAGKCSLGVQVDFLPSFHAKVDRLVGFINPNMPRTAGEGLIDYSALSGVVDYDAPLVTVVPKSPDPAAIKIAANIVELVPDHATVQFGVGQIPSQVVVQLKNHRGLRIHSGVVDDSILALDASGALDQDSPIITGTAIGSKQLYEALAGNGRFSFRSVSYTHSHSRIAGLKRFTAVNSVLQADLLGQVSAEYSGGKLVASPGGLPDFARGALDSEGGQSIIALRAQGGGHAKGIVPLLDVPHAATGGAVDADIIVTEFGAARIGGLSLDRRAEAMIAIADPEDQSYLAEQWSKIRSNLFARS